MFEHYMGERQAEGYSDPLMRQRFYSWLERVRAYTCC